ncbi:Stage V sporulation protein whose disruption leads to the production of immature spores (SpoVK) [Anaerovibrio sp. JC8]|uniref:AAA family ATPase n=1 Tax=Anaerovibrio sp. JC8 TaxID=1240085 RepID=UPI000A0A10DD|nr:AAA family ATPase [Anaerovibrio sp. JC8]ORT99715.1 Stage V sporulation protein whose disruption leads to the production of immature spores (SpoVK) [Anaerovibrio sp. JC8]
MNEKIENFIKFWFPEYQIIECLQKHGFIESEKPANNYYSTTSPSYSNGNLATAPANNDRPVSINTSIFSTKNNSVTTESKTNSPANDTFAYLGDELKKQWIGSEEDITSLCKAFERPYVRGFDNNKPRNVMLIVGHESRGKLFAVRCISDILKKKKVFKKAEVSLVNFSDYDGDSTNNLFMSDLYKALNAKGESVAFEAIDKASPAQLDILYQLITVGYYKLSKRYMMLNGSLMEAAGVLDKGLVSQISANGKFFIFTSTCDKNNVLSSLGNKIIKEIDDVIVLEPFSQEQKIALGTQLLIDFKLKCNEKLNIPIIFDNSLINEIIAQYKVNRGVKALSEHIDEQLYEPLTEMVLQKKITNAAESKISYNDGYIVTLSDGTILKLIDYTNKYNSAAIDEARHELEQVVGLTEVKEYILNLENNYKVQHLRERKGLKRSELSMHMIFTGNPGTGKTTIARIVAKYLKAIGVLSSGHLCEVTRADLVAEYVGHTAVKTSTVIKSALGGVLFIDEAYALCRNQSDVFGLEAIDTLVKAMEDNRDNLVVILAGYDEEMSEFLKTNSGLKSRFPNVVHFDDYTVDEMYKIAQIATKSKGYSLSAACEDGLRHQFELSQSKDKKDSGNGRLVRNLIEKAILNQSQRIVKNPGDDMELLMPEDFGFTNIPEFDLDRELDKVIGLGSVKKYIRSLNARLKLQAERKKVGLKTDNTQTMHMIFTGNPGTGKTMMARTVANVLYNMNVIKTNNLVETDRSGLVAGYVGQTAIKTREVIESALGGVLFIDEAYALAQGGQNDFGQEAIDTLVKMMDDNRDNLVVILAGYNDDMRHFLTKNVGLHSRFPNIIEFPDYTVDELMQIADGMYSAQGYVLNDKGKKVLQEHLVIAKQDTHFGNGRHVRNVFERSLNNQALRLSGKSKLSKEDLITITEEDIRGV